MSARVSTLCAVLLCASAAHAAPETPLKPADFAYGRDVQLPDDPQPVVSVALPLDVYRAMRGPDLRELMVFNGRDTQVPHAIRSLRAGPTDAPETVPLALFPLPLSAAGKAGNLETALVIQRDPAGQITSLIARSSTPAVDGGAEPEPRIAAYVLDGRALPRALVALRVQLRETADDRVLGLRVETSEDLVTFDELPVAGALIQLGHGGRRIDRDLLSLPPTRASFYRLSPVSAASFPSPLVAVQATLATLEAPQPFERLDSQSTGSPAPHVYRFDLGGPVPVDRVELALPEQNTVVNAELYASDDPAGPYHSVLRARLYRVALPDRELSGPTLDVVRRNARYYELRVDPTGGGLGSGAPKLISYHAPDQLLFLRRGEGPFLLAYGRYRAPNDRFEADDLLTLLPKSSTSTSMAKLGEVKQLGGDGQLRAPAPPPPYKTYVMWAVLIAGVFALGALALSLARSGEKRS
ncbi:MAG TPA: DUF3999 family protein [Polyangiales bacterium]|nr:DUF3999 family protein [Polyangiales bacterium]